MRWLIVVCAIICFIPYKASSQTNYSITVLNKNSEPIPFAVGITVDTIAYSNALGQLKFANKPVELQIYAVGYKSLRIDDSNKQVVLDQSIREADNAVPIITKVIENEALNNPFKVSNALDFKRYNRTLIKRDSISYKANNENLFSERISRFYVEDNAVKEFVDGQKNQGFEQPVLKILSHRMHDLNWYDKTYVIFESDYASPIHHSNLKGYNYYLIHSDENFYFIKFTPNKQIEDRLLEGVLLIDKNFALAGIYVSKNDEIKLDLNQKYEYNSDEKLWVSKQIDITMTPGKGGKL
ncbi:MAG: hypothetical protein V2I33_25390, partial [Kangiellaceae bacterium]|nr:hypothetical protein [Kangiellaceae bacterium]